MFFMISSEVELFLVSNSPLSVCVRALQGALVQKEDYYDNEVKKKEGKVTIWL